MAIEKCIESHGVKGRVVAKHSGPVVVTYEVELEAGQKVKSLTCLDAELGMALKSQSVRIAPLPERGTIGIELPRDKRDVVTLRDVITSPTFETTGKAKQLTLALGRDALGADVVVNLDVLPHLLIAGATGTGKSVCLNTILLSLLRRYSPKDLGLILIDPKILEFALYERLPHLLHPVVIDGNVARSVLAWCVKEMETRYSIMKSSGTRNLDEYNRRNPDKAMRRIVIIVDELADLVLAGERTVSEHITRLAQKARASGMHLILATQRPSVDVVTGLIKANFPARLAFRVASNIDSRVILDSKGAEKLLGRGDSLLVLPGGEGQKRVHCCYVSDDEVQEVCNQLRQLPQEFDDSLIGFVEDMAARGPVVSSRQEDEYEKIKAWVLTQDEISASVIQAQFSIGVAKAAKFMSRLVQDGVVSGDNGSRGRKLVLKGLGDV